ncbi:MAG: sigma-70 family RNA polymerase sigma factor [Planctomycetales bacterium]
MDTQRIVELVRLAQRGDREAFGQLVEHFDDTVFWIVLRRLRNRSEAREVAQEVFLRAMRKLGQLRQPERFAGWLRRIAVRMSINRATRRPLEAMPGPETFAGLASNPRAPLEDALRRERAGQVRDGLERLREVDRQTLLAFYFEGRSLKEMSVRFDSPIGTIKRRLHTARNRLRKELADLQPAART